MRWILILSIFLLSSCSSTVYEQYSLIDSKVVNNDLQEYDLRVFVSENLNDGGIIIKTSDVSLKAASNHRWVRPLSSQLSVIINNYLYEKKFNKNYEYICNVVDFSGTTDGMADVAINFIVKNDKQEEIFNRTISSSIPLPESGYVQLVRSLKSSLYITLDTFAHDFIK